MIAARDFDRYLLPVLLFHSCMRGDASRNRGQRTRYLARDYSTCVKYKFLSPRFHFGSCHTVHKERRTGSSQSATMVDDSGMRHRGRRRQVRDKKHSDIYLPLYHPFSHRLWLPSLFPCGISLKVHASQYSRR